MPTGLGIGEMILIFLVVLLLFGARRLPEIGTSLGKGIREFKKSVREIEGELKIDDRPRVSRPAPAEEAPQLKSGRVEQEVTREPVGQN